MTGLSAVRDVELLVDVFEMKFDGVGTNLDPLGDLGVGLAFRYQGQDFILAFGESNGRVVKLERE